MSDATHGASASWLHTVPTLPRPRYASVPPGERGDVGTICRDVIARVESAFPGRYIHLARYGGRSDLAGAQTLARAVDSLLRCFLEQGRDPVEVRTRTEAATASVEIACAGRVAPSAHPDLPYVRHVVHAHGGWLDFCPAADETVVRLTWPFARR